jgi:ribokinase
MSTVLVVGSANVDLQVEAPHLPSPGETVLGGVLLVGPGGKGANQAVAARRLGAQTRLVCALGDDAYAATVLDCLTGEGVDTGGIRKLSGVATGVALITVAPEGENTFVVAPGANAELRPEDVSEHVRGLAAGDVLVLQLEVPVPTALAAAKLGRDAGAAVVLNSAPMPKGLESLTEVLPFVDVLVANESEARALAGVPADESVRCWQALADRLRASGPTSAVVTLGTQGAVAATGTGTFRQPAFEVDAIDTTGAGDVFTAALAVGLAAGLPMPSALRRACAAGALATTIPGAQAGAPQEKDVDRLLELTEEAV